MPRGNTVSRLTGTVKWWNDVKGFGFITPTGLTPSRGNDVFVHFSAISDLHGGGNERRTLVEGERVEVEIVQGRKGLEAADVVSIA